jgi:hypothetical protein
MAYDSTEGFSDGAIMVPGFGNSTLGYAVFASRFWAAIFCCTLFCPCCSSFYYAAFIAATLY